MAIEELGQSLLARKQRLNEEERKRQEKAQRQGQLIDLATMGVRIGNKLLAEKTNNFLNNEAVLAKKAQYKAAAYNAEQLFKEQDAINASGLSAEEYFFKAYRDPFEARAREVVPFEQVGEAGAYNQVISDEVRKLAQQRAEAHREGLGYAEKIVDEEDFDSMISLNARKARPTNVFGLLNQSAQRMFKGKKKDEFDAEALASIRNSDMAANIDQMEAFEKRYAQTKNLVGAYDFAKLVVPDTEDAKELTDVSMEVKGVGSNLITVRTTTTTNRNTGEKRESISTTSEKLDEKSVADLDKLAVKSAKDAFDFAKDGRDALTTEAYANFAAEVEDTLGVSLTDPTLTFNNYVDMADIYNQYITQDTFVKDAFRDNNYRSAFDILASEALDIKSLLLQLEEDPSKRSEKLAELTGLLVEAMRSATNVSDFSKGLNWDDQ